MRTPGTRTASCGTARCPRSASPRRTSATTRAARCSRRWAGCVPTAGACTTARDVTDSPTMSQNRQRMLLRAAAAEPRTGSRLSAPHLHDTHENVCPRMDIFIDVQLLPPCARRSAGSAWWWATRRSCRASRASATTWCGASTWACPLACWAGRCRWGAAPASPWSELAAAWHVPARHAALSGEVLHRCQGPQPTSHAADSLSHVPCAMCRQRIHSQILEILPAPEGGQPTVRVRRSDTGGLSSVDEDALTTGSML